MSKRNVTILGAGLAGISTSFHIGHQNCILFEAKSHIGGHIHSEQINGYTWDEGPHVSFTKHQYVKDLFEKSVNGELLEYPVHPTNYFKGSWIPHPAQTNLYAVPEPLRSQCLDDFIATRKSISQDFTPADYAQWLTAAFGQVFAENFPFVYTEKYWTVSADRLETNWVGGRVFFPNIDQVIQGSAAPLEAATNYISSIRYPKHGGYQSFSSLMTKDINVTTNKRVSFVDLEKRQIRFEDGLLHEYDQLVSTLPLPEFVKYCQAPKEVLQAADQLACSNLLLLNFEVNHPTLRDENWLYVYDKDMYSTRINFTELLSPNNAPAGKCGIQVEVYFSKYKPIDKPIDYFIEKVKVELLTMGLISHQDAIENSYHKWIPFANVIFDHYYKESLNTVLKWLEQYGLSRENDDLLPMTDWSMKQKEQIRLGDLILAGRFGQWKYYWTDDCVLRGKTISNNIG